MTSGWTAWRDVPAAERLAHEQALEPLAEQGFVVTSRELSRVNSRDSIGFVCPTRRAVSAYRPSSPFRHTWIAPVVSLSAIADESRDTSTSVTMMLLHASVRSCEGSA